MVLTGKDFDRIPVTNLRVPVREFARLWLSAESLEEQFPGDWYVAGVVMTCRWLAGATVRGPSGLTYMAFAPVSEQFAVAYEELIDAELLAAEKAAVQRPVPQLLRDRPGWVNGVVATLAWAWRNEGREPLPLWPLPTP